MHIVAVSYLNTLPFIHGLQHSGYLPPHTLELAVPSRCAEILINGQADAGLIPVAALPKLKDYSVLQGYCIGSMRSVASVRLFSKVHLKKIKNILLDADSETSNLLLKILAKKHWNINPDWNLPDTSNTETDARLAIGDKALLHYQEFQHVYDLGLEWYRFSRLPFVYAVWVVKENWEEKEKLDFNRALGWGVKHKKSLRLSKESSVLGPAELNHYLTYNISYKLDNKKQEGMKMYLDLIKQIAS